MYLSDYKELIKSLPYFEQAFEAKKVNWITEKYKFSEHFNNFLQKYFKEDRLRLSRWDVMQIVKHDPIDAAIAVIMWGYPNGMRGNSFESLLKHVERLKYKLVPHKEITHAQFLELLQLIPGIGLSTISKFLYFFSNKLEGMPCLILDQRIIDTLQAGYFVNLRSLQKIAAHNKTLYYLQYLKTIHEISAEIECKPDQLELFLFIFGQRFKVSDKYNYYSKVQYSLHVLNTFEKELTKALYSLIMSISKDNSFLPQDQLAKEVDVPADTNAQKLYNLINTIAQVKSQLEAERF